MGKMLALFMRQINAKIVIIDAYGVFNFGKGISPNAIATFQQWLNEGKKVYILSNTTALNDGTIKSYEKKGVIKGIHYTDMMTSGQYAHEDILAGNLPVKGKKYFVFGTPNFKNSNPIPAIFNGSEYEVVKEISEADFIYCGIPQLKDEAGEAYDSEKEEDFLPLVQELAKSQKPLVCANPDKTANEGGRFVIRQGTIAELYQKFGGQVILYGKPDSRIFNKLIERYCPQVPRQEMLMVGDTVHTDIKGATLAGIPSALVLEGGVSARDMALGQMPLEMYLKTQGFSPTYVWERVCEEPLF